MGTPLHVTVRIPTQRGSEAGKVTAVAHEADGVRVAVAFPAEAAPTLQIGRGAATEFTREDVEPPNQTLRVMGRVVRRKDDDGERTYEFMFSDVTRQSLAYLLEPRRSFRAYPDPDEPVVMQLTIEGDDEFVLEQPIRDVSTTGVGIEVPWEAESALCKASRVGLTLQFPGHENAVQVAGIVRSRTLGRSQVVYGVQFDGLESVDPALALIATYITSRAGGLTTETVRREAG